MKKTASTGKVHQLYKMIWPTDQAQEREGKKRKRKRKQSNNESEVCTRTILNDSECIGFESGDMRIAGTKSVDQSKKGCV